jgi:uncharacterized protein YggE
MADRQDNNLTVTGTGKVQAVPDEAIVHFTVITEAPTASEAVATNARQTQAVIDAVSALPNHGVTTSGLSVYPLINYPPDGSPPMIVGYRATNSVNVATKIEYVGEIYDAGIGAGANQSGGITFRIRDEGPLRDEALRLAVDEAFHEAKVVSDAAGVGLGEAESIQVEPADRVIYFRAEAFDARAATPVIPEPQTVTARVQIQFRTRAQVAVQQPGKAEIQQVAASQTGAA